MIYRICYSKAMREKLKLSYSFDYLSDLDIADTYDPITNEVLEYAQIIDRESAETYISNHKDQFDGIADGGCTGRIFGWCIEYTDNGKATALLYEHTVYGLIWININ